MLSMKRIGLTGTVAAFVLACVFAAVSPAVATTTSDDGAAILVWPKVVADDVGVCVSTNSQNNGLSCADVKCDGYCKLKDTVIQVSNLNDTEAAAAHCYYINANKHCSNDGSVCVTSADCAYGSYVGSCVQGCSELDFDVRITPNQPLVWRVLEGLGGVDLPLPQNAGTRVPPVPETPFIGELKCIQVDANSSERWPAVCSGGTCRNDLIGQAEIEEIGVSPVGNAVISVDPKWYNAVGVRNPEQNDGNNVLSLDGQEYEQCPAVLVLNHLFDGAIDPISGDYPAHTELSLVPCSENLLTQEFDAVTAQFLVYNEFEQRFSTSIDVACLVDTAISRIDTSQPERSIFSAGVAGTVAGNTRIRGVDGGLLGVAVLNLGPGAPMGTLDPGLTAGAAYNLNQVGGNHSADTITIP